MSKDIVIEYQGEPIKETNFKLIKYKNADELSKILDCTCCLYWENGCDIPFKCDEGRKKWLELEVEVRSV